MSIVWCRNGNVQIHGKTTAPDKCFMVEFESKGQVYENSFSALRPEKMKRFEIDERCSLMIFENSLFDIKFPSKTYLQFHGTVVCP